MLSSIFSRGGRSSSSATSSPAFPTQQLFILALCRICEPIAFMSIFPYVYYMIRSFEITSDDRQIAVYAGTVTSAFAFAEFSTGVIWGRLSDKMGRKPILISGLAGTALSMLVFGFAPTLPVALLGRALGGLLNGNVGVLQTTVAEIVTVKEHQPRAYSIMPFVWCLGSILGPALGGALAQPCVSYPNWFARGTIFDHYPFLLPNLVCAIVLGLGVLIGILFLEETHEHLKHRRDVGLEVGQWILKRFRSRTGPPPFKKADETNIEEVRSLLEDDLPPSYCTREGSPCSDLSRAQSPDPKRMACQTKSEKRIDSKSRGAQQAFTKQVMLNIIGYGLLAYHSISFDQLMPVFLSEPISHEPPSLPFKFTGGFALSSKTIGFLLSLQGIYSMMAQIVIFPLAVRHFGCLNTFRFVVISWPILYFLVPYLVFLPERLQMFTIYFCLTWKITAQVLAFPANAILLTNSAPSMLVLGAINGVAASTASLMRAFGPTVTGFIHSLGLEMGYTGFAWWASGLICLLGAVESFWMLEGKGRLDQDRIDDEEAGSNESLIDPKAVDAAILAAGGSGEDLPESTFTTQTTLSLADSKRKDI